MVEVRQTTGRSLQRQKRRKLEHVAATSLVAATWWPTRAAAMSAKAPTAAGVKPSVELADGSGGKPSSNDETQAAATPARVAQYNFLRLLAMFATVAVALVACLVACFPSPFNVGSILQAVRGGAVRRSASGVRIFSEKELAAHDGRGRTAYLSILGSVYDVTSGKVNDPTDKTSSLFLA